jgi:membrane protein required for beta-lactamase induction
MIAFSFLMKTSPSILIHFVKNQSTEATIVSLFLISLWSYLIFMRAFIGASIGEWTCDLRLGEPMQRFKKTYLLRVILRTTLILLTGVFVLPLISLLTKKDIAGLISGVRIYSLQ